MDEAKNSKIFEMIVSIEKLDEKLKDPSARMSDQEDAKKRVFDAARSLRELLLQDIPPYVLTSLQKYRQEHP